MSGTASGNTQSANDLTSFDPRLLSVQIEINGQLTTFNEGFWIRCKGEKFANAVQNKCTVEIANLQESTRNYLLTETSPFNQLKTPKVCNVLVGRKSTGLFLLYTGNIMDTKISQPPDITLKLECGTGHAKKGSVGRRSGGKVSKLSTLAGGIASNLGLSLRMEAPDTSVANYAHSGNALDEVDKIGKAGKCDAYVDDAHLILKLSNTPLSGSVLNLSAQTGMVGVPEITDKGLKVKFLYDSTVKLGGGLQITSKLNPSANGLFVIFKLRFDVSSRENEFYYEAECIKSGLAA
jgi:hypothetical protein